MTLVPGDPGSLSALGATLGRSAAAVHADAQRLAAAYRDLGREWGGRASARTRRRGEALGSAADVLAEQLSAVGVAHQEHATDVAELVAAARALTERAAADGLRVREGRVELDYGVTGEAIAARAEARERRRVELQGALDVVLTQLERRRRRLLALVAESTRSLARASESLRNL